MNKEDFVIAISKELQKRMDEGVVVKTHHVKKNNNVTYCGLIIQHPEKNISPTIYLDGFYELYQEGEGLEMIVERILQLYHKGEVKEPIDMGFFLHFDKVKERIAYRLINAEKNKELLEQIPHILFLDLAICFYYSFYNEELGEGMILIHNSHMEMWETNHRELMQLAQENTKKLFPHLIVSMETLLQGMYEERGETPFYVLTNNQKCQGAAAILYDEVLEEAAERLKGNYYILPSSIHEVILLKDYGSENVKALHEMIVDANSNHVLTEEILSDYPYYYDRNQKKILQIKGF